jgi:hypothetical protein
MPADQFPEQMRPIPWVTLERQYRDQHYALPSQQISAAPGLIHHLLVSLGVHVNGLTRLVDAE